MGLVFILLTITGMFMEVGATNVILSPLLAPVAAAFGIDPIHFGMVFVFLLALGQATPALRVHHVHRLRNQRRAGGCGNPAACCPLSWWSMPAPWCLPMCPGSRSSCQI